VNNHLPGEVYCWKISDRFTAGVPDSWYSGSKGSLFVEYKLLKKLPKRAFTAKLSPLQIQWLRARYKEGQNVQVIVGVPKGGIVLTDLSWESQVLIDDCTIINKKQIADHISEIVV